MVVQKARQKQKAARNMNPSAWISRMTSKCVLAHECRQSKWGSNTLLDRCFEPGLLSLLWTLFLCNCTSLDALEIRLHRENYE